jgi:hypothetical protein
MPVVDEPMVLELGPDAPRVWIEAMPAIVRETKSGAMTPSSHGQRVASITAKTLGDAVKAVALGLHKELSGTGAEKLSLGFGMSVDTSGRALIGATGTFRVQLEWSKAKSEE